MTKTMLKTKNNEYLERTEFVFSEGKFVSCNVVLTKEKSKALVAGKIEAKERINVAKKYGNIELFEEIIR